MHRWAKLRALFRVSACPQKQRRNERKVHAMLFQPAHALCVTSDALHLCAFRQKKCFCASLKKAVCNNPNADMCVGVTCPAPKECEQRPGLCNKATGLCGAPPPKPNGTLCSIGSCQGGVCTGGVSSIAAQRPCLRCGLARPPKFPYQEHISPEPHPP